MQGIELKEAAANPLLGQGHMESSGRFVKAKLPAAAEGTAVHASSASGGDSFSFPSQQSGELDSRASARGGARMAAQPGVDDPSPFGSPAVLL